MSVVCLLWPWTEIKLPHSLRHDIPTDYSFLSKSWFVFERGSSLRFSWTSSLESPCFVCFSGFLDFLLPIHFLFSDFIFNRPSHAQQNETYRFEIVHFQPYNKLATFLVQVAVSQIS